MRVLLVSKWFWEEHRRFGAGFLREEVDALVKKGIDLVILSQSPDAGLEPERRELDGLQVWLTSREKKRPMVSLVDKLIKFWAGHRKAWTDALAVRSILQTQAPFDVVWAQTEEPDGLVCRFAQLLGAMPPLFTQIYALRYQLTENGFQFQRIAPLKWVFQKSARIGANSEATAQWMTQHYAAPTERIRIHKPHLTRPFLESLSSLSSEPNGTRLLFLGALNRKKGPDVFLKAAAILAPRFPSWKFIMVGGETEKDDAFKKELTRLGEVPELIHRVEWLGKITAAQVKKEILQAVLVICPSRIEEFSRTTIEALALGRPVILTSTTGAATWIQETGAGSVVPPGDPEALADAMADWMEHGKALSPHLSEMILQEFSAEKAADTLIADFKELTGRKA